VGAPKSTGGGYEKRDQRPGEINEFFQNKEIIVGGGCALQGRVKSGIWVFHYFYTQALGAFVCVSVCRKCGVEKKLGYILNSFRPSLLDFEGFFCKLKELLETPVNIFFFSLYLSLSLSLSLSISLSIDLRNDIILYYDILKVYREKQKYRATGNLSGESTSLVL